MRRRVDSAGKSAHDDDALRDELAGEAGSAAEALRGGGSGSDNRDTRDDAQELAVPGQKQPLRCILPLDVV